MLLYVNINTVIEVVMQASFFTCTYVSKTNNDMIKNICSGVYKLEI